MCRCVSVYTCVCVCVCNVCQVIIQSGQPPTVLQQLCSLPFAYFSDARLMNILFPTLVSCCYLVDRNREILQQELSCALLANFIEVSFIDAQFVQGIVNVTQTLGTSGISVKCCILCYQYSCLSSLLFGHGAYGLILPPLAA